MKKKVKRRKFTLLEPALFPAGKHLCELSAVSECDTENGTQLVAEFTCVQGQHEGRSIRFRAAIESDAGQVAPDSQLGRLLVGLCGTEDCTGVKVDPYEYIGRKYHVTVGPRRNGKPRIDQIALALEVSADRESSERNDAATATVPAGDEWGDLEKELNAPRKKKKKVACPKAAVKKKKAVRCRS